MPASSATRPPMLLPTRWAVSISRPSIAAITERAMKRASYGGADRLGRLAEARQVEGDHAVRVRERGERGEEGGLGAAEPVQRQQRRPGARLHVGELADARAHGAEAHPARLAVGARGRQQPHAQVQVHAHAQLALLVGGHPAAHVAGDPPPGGGVGDQQGVGLARGGLAPASPRSPSITASHAPLSVHLEPDPRASARARGTPMASKRSSSSSRKRGRGARGRGAHADAFARRVSFTRSPLSSSSLRSRTGLGRDLHALVLAQELQRLVERQPAARAPAAPARRRWTSGCWSGASP